jgi:hypothetical protein
MGDFPQDQILGEAFDKRANSESDIAQEMDEITVRNAGGDIIQCHAIAVNLQGERRKIVASSISLCIDNSGISIRRLLAQSPRHHLHRDDEVELSQSLPFPHR